MQKKRLSFRLGSGGENAFTMMELLATVAIIAVLAVLLVPLAKNTRESGLQAKCVSNLRQLGLAAQNYTGEHNGWMPPMRYPYNNTWWPDALSPYISNVPWKQTLETTSPVFRCPAGTKEWPYHGSSIEITGVNYAYNVKIGYIVNADTSGGTTVPVPLSPSYRARKINGCRFPAQTGLIMDGDSQRVQFEYYSKSDVDPRSLRHSGNANVLFVDGHVDAVDFKTISEDDFKKLSLAGTYNDEWP